MQLDAVMDELATQLKTIIPRTYAYPADNVAPPAAVVAYPDQIKFDAGFARGMDTMTLDVWVVVGKVVDRASRDTIAPHLAGSGSQSVKAVLENGTYTSFSTVRVTEARLEITTYAAVDYLAAVFTLDITGSGI